MAGIATPSPIPMQALAVKRAGNPRCAAIGVTAVAMDHQTTPKPAQTYSMSALLWAQRTQNALPAKFIGPNASQNLRQKVTPIGAQDR